MSISPQRLVTVMSETMQLLSLLPDADAKLRHDSLEGETRFFAVLDGLAEEALAASKLVELARERIKRLEERAESRRDIIKRMMAIAEFPTIERPLFTASTSQRQEVVEVQTNEALPEAFIRSSPDRTLIGKTLRKGQPVPGYALQDKPELILTLRSA